MPDPGQHPPCGARNVGRPEQVRKGKRPGDGYERAEEIAAGNSKQSTRLNDRKLNEQQSRSGTVAKGTVAQNAASKTTTMASASRCWPRLGGSVDSRTCCSFNAWVVAGSAMPARESREAPF